MDGADSFAVAATAMVESNRIMPNSACPAGPLLIRVANARTHCSGGHVTHDDWYQCQSGSISSMGVFRIPSV